MKKFLKNYKQAGLIIGLLIAFGSLQAQQQAGSMALTGDWVGELNFGKQSLSLVMHFTESPDQGLEGSLDSPDQGAMGIIFSKIQQFSDSLFVECGAIGAAYRAVIHQADTTLKGIWKQGGMSFELVMKKTSQVIARRRPQEPRPPFPYSAEEVNFTNLHSGLELSGTLTLPQGNGPFPACILVSGSGAQNRDMEILGHKPFLLIADHLSRNGMAVLRYDDRGTGKSKGDFISATTLDFATDAKAAFDFLRKDARIIPSKIGIIGQSEGGIIAPIVASQNLATAFIIMLAGPSVNGEKTILAQLELIYQSQGIEKKEIKQSLSTSDEVFRVLKKTSDTAQARLKILAILAKSSDETEIQQARAQADIYNGAWFRTFLTLEPADYLKQVRCPVLALYGEKDLQVPPALNIKPLKNALVKAGNPDYEILELPGLNHLFQQSATGSLLEYGKLEETLSPKVLEIITAWLKLKTR